MQHEEFKLFLFFLKLLKWVLKRQVYAEKKVLNVQNFEKKMEVWNWHLNKIIRYFIISSAVKKMLNIYIFSIKFILSQTLTCFLFYLIFLVSICQSFLCTSLEPSHQVQSWITSSSGFPKSTDDTTLDINLETCTCVFALAAIFSLWVSYF